MADVGRASGSVAAIARQLDSLAVAVNQGGGLTAHDRELPARQRGAGAGGGGEPRGPAHDHGQLLGHLDVGEGAGRGPRRRASSAALDHFVSAAGNLDRVSGQLDSLRASLQGAASRLDRGEGTLGRLVKDERLYDGPRRLGARSARADRGPQGESAEVLQVLGVLMPGDRRRGGEGGQAPLLLHRLRQRGGALVRALPLVRGVELGGRGAGGRGGRERGGGPRSARALGAEAGARAAARGAGRGRSPTSRSRPRIAGPRACASSTACWAAA